MIWLDYVNAAAAVATAAGVFIAVWQMRTSKCQTRTQFEDSLTVQYREIISRLPIEALLGELLEEAQHQTALGDFYRYFDLSNEQIFLRQSGRVSKEVWQNWREGMESCLLRPAFKKAWDEIQSRSTRDFSELKRLESEHFKSDPYRWR